MTKVSHVTRHSAVSALHQSSQDSTQDKAQDEARGSKAGESTRSEALKRAQRKYAKTGVKQFTVRYAKSNAVYNALCRYAEDKGLTISMSITLFVQRCLIEDGYVTDSATDTASKRQRVFKA